jgi:leucyl/phenylalanyl-tRNA--protein transferase
MIAWLPVGCAEESFPPVEEAWVHPNGLLAAGGDLSLPRLLHAYRRGIFPWYEAGQPILWWSPDPRTILEPRQLHLSRSLRRALRHSDYRVSFDQAFAAVIQACAAPRAGARGTWITPEMLAAYVQLHEAGHAHSVEVWVEGNLVGGLYGVAVGRLFCGESMFSRQTDASKIALAWLCRHLAGWDWPLIDSQTATAHLLSLGARKIPRREFLAWASTLTDRSPHPESWRLQSSWHPLDGQWRG